MLLVTKLGWLSTQPVAGGYESSLKEPGSDAYRVIRRHDAIEAAAAYHERAWSSTDEIARDLERCAC